MSAESMWKVYLLFKNGNRFYSSRTFSKAEAERIKGIVESVLVGNTETVHIEEVQGNGIV